MTIKGSRTFLTTALFGVAGVLTFAVHVAGFLGPVSPQASGVAIAAAVAFAVLRAITDTPPGTSSKVDAVASWLRDIAAQKAVIDSTIATAAQLTTALLPKDATIITTVAGTATKAVNTAASVVVPPVASTEGTQVTPPTVGGTSAGG